MAGSLVPGKPQVDSDLLESALIGSHRDVQRLLEERADVSTVDRDGYTALSEASAAGHTIVVGQLLRALSDPNHQATDGRTALHRSAFQGWVPVVRLLLEGGADPSVEDNQGKTSASLTSDRAVVEVIRGFPEERTRELREELAKKLPARPVPVQPQLLQEIAAKPGEGTTEAQAPRTRRFEAKASGHEARESSELPPPSLVEVMEESSAVDGEEVSDAQRQLAEAEVALQANPSDMDAHFASAKALFDMGELEDALAHANRCVEHYERSSETPNPEVASLRAQILDDLKRERAKFGQKGTPTWNRSGRF